MKCSMAAVLGLVLLTAALVTTAEGSTLTQPQIEKALTDMESCIRTMCIPANDASMSLGFARDLRGHLAVTPNALDQWTLGRLDPIITLLAGKQLAAALARTQATIAGLIRPAVLTRLKGLETCVRTMCLPAGDATMGMSTITTIDTEMARYPGAFGQFVIQRLNAAALLLKDKKIREGLAAIQATIAELPNP